MASTSRIRALQAAAALALAAAPVYWLQGRCVRRRAPRLAEAPGKRHGVLPGRLPAWRVVGLGESPMAAVGLADQSEGLVARLATQMSVTSGRRVVWATAARSGATAQIAREELLPRLEQQRADLVVIALGVNDCLALRSARRWRHDLQALVRAVGHRLEPARIVLTGIPPMQHFPALPAPLSTMLGLRAALLDSVAAHLARGHTGLVHAPMDLADRADELFCRDGFHPNAAGHALWARQLAELVTAS